MKKTVFTDIHGENQTLYIGIEEVYGGWILTTSGDPTCLNECEDIQAEDVISFVEETLSSPYTVWEDLNEWDEKYINRYIDDYM